MTAAYQTITIEPRGAVEVLSLARPNTLNAISPDMAREMNHYLDGLHARDDVRVVVLRAEGRAFCAGLDLRSWEGVAEGTLVLQKMHLQKELGGIIRRMRTCPQPIIAAAHGAACGGGFSMLLASDVRFGAPSLKMNAAYIKVGLGGADMGASYLLPRLVGMSLASELLLTGRFIHAERALRLGLLSDVVEEDKLLDTALALADEMLATAPHGLAMTKAVLNLNIDAQGMEAAMALEDRQQIVLMATHDHQEAIDAFTQKRPPRFEGR